MKFFYHISDIRYFIVALLALISVACAYAFPTDTYASKSVLAEGKWVKVSVQTTGIHFIPASELRKWGFNDPMNVRVHGYGGNLISDVLSINNYRDDLPEVQSENTAEGIYFYALGPVSWAVSRSSRFTRIRNAFSDYGYYFLTESTEPQRELPVSGISSTPAATPTRYIAYDLYEKDLANWGPSGYNFYGDQFVGNTSQTFRFFTPNYSSGASAWLSLGFATDGNSPSSIQIQANDRAIGTSFAIKGRNWADNDAHVWAYGTTVERSFALSSDILDINVNFNPGTVRDGRLDYIVVNYYRGLVLNGNSLQFNALGSTITLEGATADTRVWDVSDPVNISAIDAMFDEGKLGWRPVNSQRHDYVAWKPVKDTFPSPTYVSTVNNQNLHDSTLGVPDMVIVTLPPYASQAERVANLHRYGPDSLAVRVVSQYDVYNEFSSGAPDVGANRRFFKMLYDRGIDSTGVSKFKYALLFGPATFDFRQITSNVKVLGLDYIPEWQTAASIDENYSFATDDVMAMLGDNSGGTTNAQIAASAQSIALGRIPARSLNDAKTYVDKLVAYQESPRDGLWRNIVLSVADNADQGTHLDQTENMISNMLSTAGGRKMIYNKVYLDAYDVVNNVCVDARERTHNQINEGALFWTYVGHGNLNSLTGENVIRNTDIDKFYNRNLPVFYSATCNFLQWDDVTPSGAERLCLSPTGGLVSAISTTRVASIPANGRLSAALGKQIFETDAAGRVIPVAEALRRAKNTLASAGDENHLRYVYFGSPAMRMNAPAKNVVLETIDGEEVTPDNQVTLKARQRATLTGIVCDASGNKLTDFTGQLYFSIYDALESVTTKGLNYDGTLGQVRTYDDQSSLLYQGRDSVINGEFTVVVPMPSDIADNFRPALMSFYACSLSGDEASGACRDFYVFGVDENAATDTIPPTVTAAYMNHESFKNGDVVNEDPMYIAEVTDNVGINLSSAGVGHQMTLTLDGKTIYSDLSLYYTPYSDGRVGGTINYPLPVLTEGNHSLTLRVWDTSGNASYHTVNFFVQQGARPAIFDIFSDANPATSEANFYLQHNRPGSVITVTFEIYDIAGRRIWTATSTDRSEMFLSTPIKWNLCTLAGTRVQRGIYIYRAIVKTNDTSDVVSKAKRIAVAGR